LLLIHCLSFSPVTGTKNTNHATAPGKSHRDYSTIHCTETKITFLTAAVHAIFGNDTISVASNCFSFKENQGYAPSAQEQAAI